MANYRRVSVPGGLVFLPIVTYQREPIFASDHNVSHLRSAVRQVMRIAPFKTQAAVVLPDHVHFLWNLPQGKADYSSRVGRMKVLFTRSLRGLDGVPDGVSESRRSHRESDVWQRRFWVNTVKDEDDLELHLDYIHYNPVKHGLVPCPHLWPHSSFKRWVRSGLYDMDWGCFCEGRNRTARGITRLSKMSWE